MRVFYFYALFLMIFFAADYSQASVQYTIRGVSVDVSDSNAIKAKEKAFVQARANAFQTLIKRISDNNNSNTYADIQTPPDNILSTMVDSFEINREKTSKNRYVANLNIVFNPRAVDTYIGRMSVVALPENNNVFDAQRSNGQALMNARNLTQSTMRLDFNGFSDWLTLKKLIQSIATVGNISVDQMQINSAVITVFHQGTINQLQGMLIPNGLKLYNNRHDNKQTVPYVLQRTEQL